MLPFAVVVLVVGLLLLLYIYVTIGVCVCLFIIEIEVNDARGYQARWEKGAWEWGKKVREWVTSSPSFFPFPSANSAIAHFYQMTQCSLIALKRAQTQTHTHKHTHTTDAGFELTHKQIVSICVWCVCE